MTLSLSTNTFNACLESVLWEPGVSCNVAGAVLHAINKVLGPMFESNDYELIAKVFSSTKAAPLWLGVALCNLTYPLQTCLKYGDSFTRKWAGIAPWTGIAQSFLDLETRGPYLRADNTVTRAHVWGLRRDCSDRYPVWENYLNPPDQPWPPFGFMYAKDVDMGLQGHLRCPHHWKYIHWTWLLPKPITDQGFTAHRHIPEPPIPLPMMDISVGGDITVAKSDIEAMHRISNIVTKSVFFWSRSQVEKDFTHNIVSKCYYGNEAPEGEQSDKEPADSEVISKWRDGVVAPEDDSEDELCMDF